MKDWRKKLIANLFSCDPAERTDEMSPDDIRGWGSPRHVASMAVLQEEFGARVPVEDAVEVESIADRTTIVERILGIGS